mgnify:CR=1 FL=1
MRKLNKVNSEIKSLFISDQADRRNMRFDKKSLSILKKKDKERMRELSFIIKTKKAFAPREFYMIAMLYQHGFSLSDYKKAVSFAHRGMKDGFEKAKWLYAAATDRLLMAQKKKQRYGTQYIRKRGKWDIYPVNPRTTDKERAQYNISSIKEIMESVIKFNKNK